MHQTDAPENLDGAATGLVELRAMIKERRLTKDFLQTEDFRRTWKKVQRCLVGDSGDDVWVALSVAGRAASISKRTEEIFLPVIKRRLAAALPAWTVLEDGEDRFYLAKALQSSPNDGVVDLAFAETAREEGGEKARRVWARMAFEQSSSREEFLSRLNMSIARVKEAQDLTADSLIRRLRRINNVIAEDLATAEKPTGGKFGDVLRGFYAGHAAAKGPEDRELREEGGTEFARSLANIVRLNAKAASEPSVYGVLTALRRWWRPSVPPARFEALSRKTAQAGMEALHLYARQGISNKLLRQAIVDACGERVVDQLARSVAESDVSLPEEVAYWFLHGGEQAGRRSTAAIEALSDRRLDENIGRLLIAISSPDADFRTIRSVADQVSVLMPEEANSLLRASNRLAQIASWARAIARSRDMELLGTWGEIVAYDPAIHDAAEDRVVGSKVIVAAPGAVRQTSGRPRVLIVKVEVRGP